MDDLFLMAMAQAQGVEVEDLAYRGGDSDLNAAYATANESPAVKEYHRYMKAKGRSPSTGRRVKRA